MKNINIETSRSRIVSSTQTTLFIRKLIFFKNLHMLKIVQEYIKNS